MPKKVTRCHWVFSWVLPSRSLRTLVVARLILVIAMPPWVYLLSGSLPRLPIRIALLMPRAMDASFRVGLRGGGRQAGGFGSIPVSTPRQARSGIAPARGQAPPRPGVGLRHAPV